MRNSENRFVAGEYEFTGNKTEMCGIINVTPDSFSDGGKFFDVKNALNRAKILVKHGAAMIDVGGESTRPHSRIISAEEECARILPVIKALKEEIDVPISVDTWKAAVAREALNAGADVINDITGLLGDEKMANVIKAANASVILMANATLARENHAASACFPHFAFGNPFSKTELSVFSSMSATELVKFYIKKSLEKAENAGITKEKILIDPGIGFGFTNEENFEILSHLSAFTKSEYFVFLGVSRKRFLRSLFEDSPLKDEKSAFEKVDLSSSYVSSVASFAGVKWLRVHTTRFHFDALKLVNAIKGAKNTNFDSREIDKITQNH